MKKTLYIFLCFAIIFSFVSCGSPDTAEENTTDREIIAEDETYIFDRDNMSETEEQTTSVLHSETETKEENTTEKIAETTTIQTTTSIAQTTTEKKETVTISIVCKTVLNNMDKLKSGKEYFVPADGIVMGSAAVEVSDGDTVFDILKKVCEKNNIQFEYSYSSAFETYYIEGINQLYEKDCGSLSGWLYSVNGEFPSVGCSLYDVKDGDDILFVYSCDMGADIGA